jgi:PilZ domain
MDFATTEQSSASNSHRRRSLRRAVSLEASLLSDGWDGSVPFTATNLSPEGLWLETDLPLDLGEEVVVSFRPPTWSAEQPMRALARVTRVGLYRRKREHRRSGMGLRFVALDPIESAFLRSSLRGLPPPLPVRDARRAVIEIERPSLDDSFGAPDLTLADGRRFVFRAEGALLTAGRGPAPEIAPQPMATVHRLSAPMSAIFDRAAMRTRLEGTVAC